MGEKKGNNGDEKNNNNGGEGINFRLRIKGHVKVDLELRVTPEADLRKPRDMVEPKGKKKVELVSPLQKKDNKKGGRDDGGGGGGQKDKEHPGVIKLDPKEKVKKSVVFVLPKKQCGGNKKEKRGPGEKKEKGGGEGGKGKKDGGGVLPKK